jgi:hypothetical protein
MRDRYENAGYQRPKVGNYKIGKKNQRSVGGLSSLAKPEVGKKQADSKQGIYNDGQYR